MNIRSPGPRDPFLAAVLAFVEPVLTLLGIQDAEALTVLCAQYPEFRAAYIERKVGHHFMMTRSDTLAKDVAPVPSQVHLFDILSIGLYYPLWQQM
jgi:hypothetical protein